MRLSRIEFASTVALPAPGERAKAWLQVIHDQVFSKVESLFGPPAYDFTLLAPFWNDETPMLRFEKDRKDRGWVEVTKSALFDTELAHWQMAHECIHALGPVPLEQNTVLEEGIAAWIQDEFGNHCLARRLPVTGSYRRAIETARKAGLLDTDIVRRIRSESGGRISLVNREWLKAEFKVSDDLTDRLLMKWNDFVKVDH